MKESVKKSRLKSDRYQSHGHAIPTEKLPAPSQGHTVDGKSCWWVKPEGSGLTHQRRLQARVDTGAATSSISAQESPSSGLQLLGTGCAFSLSHQEMDDKITD